VCAVDVTSGSEHGRQPSGRAGVAGRLGGAVRALRTGEISALLQQRAQIEGPVLVAPLVGALVAGARALQVPSRFIDDAEVQCGARVPQFLSFAVGQFGARQVAALFEQNTEPEPLDGRTGTVDQCVHAPRHLPVFQPSLAMTSLDLVSLDLFVPQL
jgi:hypothetical protein